MNISVDTDFLNTQANTEPSQIYLVGGRKGGVGKTFLSRHLAEYLTQKQKPFTLIEADVTIADVGTIYGGFEEGKVTSAINLRLSDDPKRYNAPDVIFQQALKKQYVLVNLPAETNDALARWMQNINLIGLCEDGNIQIFHWFVTDGCYASIRLLLESLKLLDSRLPHIIIRNEGRLNGVDFSYLDEEPLYQEILTANNCVCIRDFPVLGSAEQFYLDKHQLTYEAGVMNAKENLGLIQAQRIKTFAEQSFAVLDEISLVDIPAFEKKFYPARKTKNSLSDSSASSRVEPNSNRRSKAVKKGKNDTLDSTSTDIESSASAE